MDTLKIPDYLLFSQYILTKIADEESCESLHMSDKLSNIKAIMCVPIENIINTYQY